MIARRATLLGLIGTGVAHAATEVADTSLDASFRVLRNGNPIGTHSISIEPVTGGFDVHIDVDIKYSIGPITLYRYRLRGREQWRDGRFVQLDARTDDDGTAQFATITRQGSSLWVSGSANSGYHAPENALPGTHWNKNELAGPWISPQDGKLLAPAVTDAGAEPLAGVRGVTLRAEHFVMSGDVRMELWYTADRRWACLRAPAADGSVILYDPI